MSFAKLLIHTCTIQSKSLNTSGYEKIKTWSDLFTNVPCRHDSDDGAKIQDAEMRTNTDDDIFFFNPGVAVVRGHRIVQDGNTYDVIKVNKLYDAESLHHLEVKARIVDHN